MTSIPLVASLLLILISIAATEKVCPGYSLFMIKPEKCESTCSPTKDECRDGKKCCYRMGQPCGHHCIVPKDNIKKSGLCPALSSVKDNPVWGLCDGHMCDVDNDCPGEHRCCFNMCGSPVCIQPDFVVE